MNKIAWGAFLGILLWGSAAAASTNYGIFVGLNQYNTSYIPSDNWLNYCVPDAVSLRTNLIFKGGGWSAGNTILRTNATGTKANIRLALSNYAAKAISGDCVVYFHSSHGGNDDATPANGYLCAYDASYTEDELATDLSAFRTGVKVIVIVDACHSGGLFYETAAKRLGAKTARAAPHRAWNLADRVTARMKRLRAARLKTNRRLAVKLVAPEEVGWMTACAYSQYSYESEDIGHGWFTHRLIQGFQYGDVTGDGWASFQELFDYAYLHIPYVDQTPQDANPTILATLAGTAGAAPAGDAWDYVDNMPDGAPDLGAPANLQTAAVHSLRKDLDESDFYAFQVRRGVTYVFRSTNTAGDGDVDAELYVLADSPQAGPQLIRYAYDIAYPDNLEFELNYKASATGPVYLRVKPYLGTGTTLTYQLAYAAGGAADPMLLTNGVPVAIASVAQYGSKDYGLSVPAGQTNLTIALSGGTGDADLYAARGFIPASSYEYVSWAVGNSETISIDDPAAGEWFFSVYGYEASSNMTLRATCTPGAALIGAASNTPAVATFAVDLTNGARVAIYSATNLLPTGHLSWALRSNNAVVANGKVNLNLSGASNQLISVGRPLDF